MRPECNGRFNDLGLLYTKRKLGSSCKVNNDQTLDFRTELGQTRWGWSKHGNYSQHFYHTNVTGPKTKEEMGQLTELSTDLLTRHCHAVFSGTWESRRSDHCPALSYRDEGW